MRFVVLGPLSVVTDQEVLELRPGKQNSVLAALLLRAGQSASPDYLRTAVWDLEPPEQDRAALHSSVMRLRRQFADLGAPQDLIVTTPHGYRLSLDADQLDLLAFREAAQAAYRTSGAVVRREALRQALALWTTSPTSSDPLVNVPSAVLHRDVVPVLVEEWKQVAERFFDLELELGATGPLVGQLHAATRAYPTHEGFAAQLAKALWAAGRQQDALAEIRGIRDVLRAELGLTPGEDLRRLESDILRGEQSRERTALTVVGAIPEAAADTAPTVRLAACTHEGGPGSRPRAVAPLHGRGREIAELRTALTPPERGGLVVVSGAPAVGKTAVVTVAVADVADAFTGGVERRCGCQAAAPLPATSGGPRLVVVDDADAAQAQDCRALAGPGTWVVVVSRFGLRDLTLEPGIATVAVRPLDPASALHLAEAVAGPCLADDPSHPAVRGTTGEPAALARLGQLCGGFPGAIAMAASRLRLSRDRDVDGFLAWLGADPVRRLSLSRDPRHSIALVFEEHLARLHPATSAAFYSLAAAGCRDLDVAEAAGVLDIGDLEAEIALEELVDACLVEVDSAGRYSLLDLPRAVAAAQARRSTPRPDMSTADRRRA